MPRLAIKAAGMVTVVGYNATTSCAAIRAGIRNISETNLWDKYSGTYLAAGRVSLPQWWIGLGKLAELVAPAIHECLVAARPVPAENIPIFLGVCGPDRPFRVSGLESQILVEIEQRLGFQLHPESRVIAQDHVSVVAALLGVGDLIATGRVPFVIVAGVDSLIDQKLVEYYLDRRRLLTPNDSNGFSVGEAGSAVLVSVETGRRDELKVLGTSIGTERATIESEEPLRAEGLTLVVREALRNSGVTIQDVDYRIADLNGEHYKFKEMALAMGRFPRKPTPKLFDVWHPIEYIGDVGAAIGPLVLGIALYAGAKGYGNGPTVLSTFGNDNGSRAAVVMTYAARAAL